MKMMLERSQNVKSIEPGTLKITRSTYYRSQQKKYSRVNLHDTNPRYKNIMSFKLTQNILGSNTIWNM